MAPKFNELTAQVQNIWPLGISSGGTYLIWILLAMDEEDAIGEKVTMQRPLEIESHICTRACVCICLRLINLGQSGRGCYSKGVICI